MRYQTIIFTFQKETKSNLLFYSFIRKDVKTNMRKSTNGEIEGE